MRNDAEDFVAASDLLSFQWSRSDRGHQLATGSSGSYGDLETHIIEPRDGQQIPFEFSTDVSVFHAFADAALEAEAMLALCNEFGFLRRPVPVDTRDAETRQAADSQYLESRDTKTDHEEQTISPQHEETISTRGERLSTWLGLSRRTKEAQKLWLGLQGRADLKGHFRMVGSELWYVAQPDLWQEIIEAERAFRSGEFLGKALPEEVSRTLATDGDVLFATKCVAPPGKLLATEGGASDHLIEEFRAGGQKRMAKEALIQEVNWHLSAPARATTLKLSSIAGVPSLRLVPRSLEAFLWVQFAQEIAGVRAYRKCEACPKWFAVTEHTRRTRRDRIYCSDACKTRAYRARKQEEAGG